MSPLPTALVVSNFAIIRKTAVDVLGKRYAMQSTTWDSFLGTPHAATDFLIIDVTWDTVCEMVGVTALLEETPRVAVFSLHRNEIRVYRRGEDGPEIEAQFPSLLELAA